MCRPQMKTSVELFVLSLPLWGQIMKTCPSCHRTFEDTKKFCNFCGELLSGVTESVTPPPIKSIPRLSRSAEDFHCPNCKKQLPDKEAKFCRFCGTPLKPEPAPIESSTSILTLPGAFSKQNLKIIKPLAILIVIGIVVILFYTTDSEQDAEVDIEDTEILDSGSVVETPQRTQPVITPEKVLKEEPASTRPVLRRATKPKVLPSRVITQPIKEPEPVIKVDPEQERIAKLHAPLLFAMNNNRPLLGERFANRACAGRRWPVQIYLASFNEDTGGVSGTIEWPVQGAQTSFEGNLIGSTLMFRETRFINPSTYRNPELRQWPLMEPGGELGGVYTFTLTPQRSVVTGQIMIQNSQYCIRLTI